LTDAERKVYKKNFWVKENLNYATPHLRLRKAARLVNKIADGNKCELLDVGCGPASLMPLLEPNIDYYGIDIAIHDPAPNLIEMDFLEESIGFNGQRFDIVLAQGVFEYVAEFQAQKFAEIAKLLRDDGLFLVSYVNFDHRDRRIYWPYSNVMSFEEFRARLARYFTIDRIMPTSHHWVGRPPRARLFELVQAPLRVRIPGFSRRFAVEYFFVCYVKR
jgi:SAM-dependent methyltransferase